MLLPEEGLSMPTIGATEKNERPLAVDQVPQHIDKCTPLMTCRHHRTRESVSA